MKAAQMKETAPEATRPHPNSLMTPAQIARRKFKSSLPRKIEHRDLPPMQALGTVFTMLDQFREMLQAEKPGIDPARTIYAALAYVTPKSTELADTLTVPEPRKIGPFCEKVLALETDADFLGLVFVHVDPDTKNPAYHAVSFVVPFMTGPDAEARLLFAQRAELAKIQAVLQGIQKVRKGV